MLVNNAGNWYNSSVYYLKYPTLGVRVLKKISDFRREKEFDTKTLYEQPSEKARKGDAGSNPGNMSDTRNASDEVSSNKENSEQQGGNPVNFGSDKPTRTYEPRPLVPGDGMYEDILEHFASAPTKPKYWFEEFGDYWSCSCGHINKGDVCRNCGLERDLLRSLFILHKPAGEPGKLSKRLRKTRDQVDEEDQRHSEIEKQRKKINESRGDDMVVVPISEADAEPAGDAAADDHGSSPAQDDPSPDAANAAANDSDTTCRTQNDDTGSSSHPSEDTSAQENGSSDAAQSTLPAKINAENTVILSPDPVPDKNDNRFISFIKKRKKILIVIIILLIAAGALGVAVYRYIATPAIQYEEAMKLMSAGKYERAIEKFESLGDYRDAEEMIWECYVAMGDEQYDAGQFSEAIETYNIAMDLNATDELRDKIRSCYIGIGDTHYANGEFEAALSAYATAQEMNDSSKLQEKINQAKLGYVKANMADRTDQVEQYMAELMAVTFPGIQEIYDQYYAWHVKIIANTSSDDTSNDVSTVSRDDTVYFHSILSGGEPGETMEVYYEVTWPNGSREVYDLDREWSSGSTITARFQYPIPLFGKEGKLTFKLYDSSTNEVLGTDSVTFKN